MTGFHLLWTMEGRTPAGLTAYRALPAGIRSAFSQEFASAPFLIAAILCLAVLDPVHKASTSWFVVSARENFPLVSLDIFEEPRESPRAAKRAAGGSSPSCRMEVFRGSMHWMSHAPVLGIATPSGNDPLAVGRVLEVRRI